MAATQREIFEKLQAMRKNPGVYVLEFYHDDGCPAVVTQRESDCTCKPDVDLLAGRDWLKEMAKRQGKQTAKNFR